ncbi:phytoene desaturase family protein [Actinomycetospora soli]|uniref:phytoene desaturase family protein n=1 Tax=Actinomycetospora soli TaxID=2893887 RepID=UPI001E576ECA|nr:NAD(P)/FAD-dependent oxidoreductase [Actinomycetospora soli]MCD2190504.1 NAD(P)/FAD-dependent oxidoreductase [Actinomycetospora soli]
MTVGDGAQRSSTGATALVVGSGPNGLAAAVVLAAAGCSVTVLEAESEIGGGTRTHAPLGPGLLVDHCSGFHPMAVDSPALAGLEAHGLRWAWPEVDCAHPLDDGSAALLHRSVTTTAAGLGPDGGRYRALVAGPSRRYPDLAPDLLGPVVHVPRRPVLFARFGAPTVLPAAVLGRVFRTGRARALWAGVAAHAMRPHTEPLSSAIGLGILTAGHHAGWPVAVGGSQAIADALVARLEELGGTVETGVRVTSADQLAGADVVVHDLDPASILRILGDRLPPATRRAYRRFRRGIGSVKVDYAVDGGVPWTAPEVGRAGTVHVGGTATEIAAAESAANRGELPRRPFVLVGQQSVADPGRARGAVVPVYAYAHVPLGWPGTEAEVEALVTAQIERFAPGFRDRVVGTSVTTTAGFAATNATMVGGDILAGAKDPVQLALGPRPLRDPYATGLPGHWLASAAAPPGPGAHGMAGWHAAHRALAELRSR